MQQQNCATIAPAYIYRKILGAVTEAKRSDDLLIGTIYRKKFSTLTERFQTLKLTRMDDYGCCNRKNKEDHKAETL